MNELANRILHCDAACVVVNKIAGEAVQGLKEGMIHLPQIVAAELAGPHWPPVVSADVLTVPAAAHRLDVPVSGCVVFARTKAALTFLFTAFTGRIVEKRYWAIVEPVNADIPEDCDIVHWIEFDSRRNISIAHDEPGPGRKKAVLRCRRMGSGTHYQFLEIDLFTGRHHQIRAQLRRLGLHVKGDVKYGARRNDKAGGIRLHARWISFPCPSGGNHITVTADPPLQDNLWRAFEARPSP